MMIKGLVATELPDKSILDIINKHIFSEGEIIYTKEEHELEQGRLLKNFADKRYSILRDVDRYLQFIMESIIVGNHCVTITYNPKSREEQIRIDVVIDVLLKKGYRYSIVKDNKEKGGRIKLFIDLRIY